MEIESTATTTNAAATRQRPEPAPLPPREQHDEAAAHHVPTGHRPSTWIGVLVFALALAAGLAFLYIRGEKARKHSAAELEAEVRHSAEEPTAVDVVRVQPSPAQTLLTLPGEARSFYETTIFARTSGYLSKWYVDIGDRVSEGQVLATIETPELDDQLTAAKAKVRQLNSEVHVAETAANFAKTSFERWEALAPQGAVSQQERDQKKSELDADVAKLEAAKAQVSLGEAEVQRLTTLSSFKKVLAPFEGTITQRHVDIGALVTAGSTTNTSPLFSIAQANQVRVFVDVPQAVVPYMKVGMPVTATAREFPGRTFEGKLDRTASSLDRTSKTLRVEVLVPNKDLTLLPGMYVQVAFANTRERPPVRVPAGAICFRVNGPQVAVVAGDDHHITFRDIKIARDLGDFVEVEAGVSPNEQVALNVGSDVSDGDRVEPHELELPDPGRQPPAPGESKLKPRATASAASNTSGQPTATPAAAPDADLRRGDR
jgi:RND family efflux transporter MFP subunit